MPLYAVREQNLRSDSVAEIETEEQAEDETEYEKTVVKKAVSSLLYENAMGNGIDVRYTVAPYSVKEDIILREKTVFHSYTMHVDANGLTAVKTEDNRVEFRDAEEQMVFTLKTPYMYDAADAISGDIEIAVVQEGEDCTITYTPDSAWLNDEARVYPVTIDPESTSRYHAVSDTYVHEGDSSCCSGITPSTYERLYIGKKGGRVHRAYLKIETLPSVPAGSYIEASTLYAQCYAGTSTSKPFSLNKVTSSWNASTLGWNPQPASSDIQANVERNTSTNVIAFTNCRDTVARMYNGNMANNGFMIHYTNETQNDYNSIYSYENSNMSGHPYLWVQYRAPANIANGTYYIRNKNSGLYLDVPNWGGSGTGLKQYSFNAGTNQKWKIEKQSNGLYTFKPMHNTNLAMDVYNALDQDGAAVWTYTANGSGAQEWYIIPNLDNTYRILSRCSNGWRGLVVSGASKAEGAEVFQYTYTVTENTNDDWYLEPTAHKAFSTIGITDAGHDHTSYMDRLSNPAACIGYSQWNQSIDTSVNNIEWYYDHSSYLVIRSHGAQNRIVLGDGDLTRSDVLSWSSSRLNDMRLVLYSACSTGAGGASADNLVNATFDRGAKTVIGFQDAVNCDQANTWTKEFFIAAGERGKSVGEACTDADYWVGVYHLLFHGGTDNRLIRGSTAQKLTS